MKAVVAVVILVTLLAIGPALGYETFTSSFDFADGFHVYGWVPNPQVYGFDYYFSPVMRDISLTGATVRIASLTVTVQGHSDDSNIGWNLESYLGSSNFNLPTGQFIQTHVDPVSGYPYPRTAPIWWDLVSHKSTFSLQWYPPGDAPDLDLGNGLYAQIFCWTGYDTHCYITIDSVNLTVDGEILSRIPEPSSLLVIIGGVIAALGKWKGRR